MFENNRKYWKIIDYLLKKSTNRLIIEYLAGNNRLIEILCVQSDILLIRNYYRNHYYISAFQVDLSIAD